MPQWQRFLTMYSCLVTAYRSDYNKAFENLNVVQFVPALDQNIFFTSKAVIIFHQQLVDWRVRLLMGQSYLGKEGGIPCILIFLYLGSVLKYNLEKNRMYSVSEILKPFHRFFKIQLQFCPLLRSVIENIQLSDSSSIIM